MNINDIFSYKDIICKDLFDLYTSPYEILNNLSNYIINLGLSLSDDYILKGENIWIHKDAQVDESASITGPVIIDAFASVRHCAYIRGSVIVGKNSVIGNSCEIKNSIIFDYAQIPHFNYVGDSLIGYKAHLGAGAITSNVKADKSNVVVRYNGEVIETGRKKVGAILGDFAEIGCNCVLNPGTIIKSNSNVYPLTSVRGVIEENMIVKSMDNIVRKEEK